jgi:hypothetical protein
MIAYLVTAEHAYTMRDFLLGMGSRFARRIALIPYEQILSERRLFRADCYIFSDLDRLGADAREELGELHQQLQERYPDTPLLNHPQRSLQRYDLLRSLHQRGVNRFNAYRARSGELPGRYPALLRRESGFQNTPLKLLGNAEQALAEVQLQQSRGANADDLIFIEYLNTADEIGVFRKYGAFVVGERIVPRHLFFSQDWMVKSADLGGPDLLAEELQYLQSNPHAAQLLEICRHAGIAYGRIDYSLLEERVQVWEINTNPLVMSLPGTDLDGREQVHRRFTDLLHIALCDVDRSWRLS